MEGNKSDLEAVMNAMMKVNVLNADVIIDYYLIILLKWNLNFISLNETVSEVSQPDVGRTVSSRVSQLVGERRTVRLFTEVHQEVFIEGQTPVHRVHIDLHHH